MERPYVIASAAMSVDGYLDDVSERRLLLSNDADFDRVDEVRASVDAILVGAGTIRADDPRLLVRSAARRARRDADPLKVTLTSRGLDPGAAFFTTGDGPKLVYTGDGAVAAGLRDVATVVLLDEPGAAAVLADLAGRGVRRLLVEGGSGVHTLFLTAGCVDELHLVLAPFFVGQAAAARFVGAGDFPCGPANPMRLAEVRPLGDVVLLRYLLTSPPPV